MTFTVTGTKAHGTINGFTLAHMIYGM